MAKARGDFTDILIKRQTLSPDQLEEAQNIQKQTVAKLPDAIVKLGYASPEEVMSAVAEHMGQWPDVVSMPGRKVVLAGRLVAVVDTSGSIDEPTLARFLGAVAAAATAEGLEEVRLMQADSEVTSDAKAVSSTRRVR